MWYRGECYSQKNWSREQKLENNLKLHKELSELYGLITKLVIVCLRKNLKLIIENPYSSQHYLTRYWCIKPSVIDYDRRERGDYYTKPTQYWFINCEPKNNLVFESLEPVKHKTIAHHRNQVERSLIAPQYARRFLKEFVLDEE